MREVRAAVRHARPTVICLSTTPLTDRILLHTDVLDRIAEDARVVVWSNALAASPLRGHTRAADVLTQRFPVTHPLRFRYQLLRRVLDFAWDHKQLSRSRESFWRLRRREAQPRYMRALRIAGRVMGAARLEWLLEHVVERALVRSERSPDATARLAALRPALLVTTSPFREQEPAIVAAAKRLGIPVAAFITSWDNLSTKNRLGFRYDGYLVWSEQMRAELLRFYAQAARVPVSVVGAPQFDVFAQSRFWQTREEFCANEGLRADRPIIVYGLGSPNLLREEFGAIDFARRVLDGEFGNAQLLIRPHPVFRAAPALKALAREDGRVVIQESDREAVDAAHGVQDESHIRQWVNTFRHADVVINLSSTISVDAALCDRPVVNLDYDPEPGRPQQQLVKEINHTWDHFKPVAESGGVWLVKDEQELGDAVRAYLADPSLHRAERHKIVSHVCGYADGRCGERLGAAVATMLGRQQPVEDRWASWHSDLPALMHHASSTES